MPEALKSSDDEMNVKNSGGCDKEDSEHFAMHCSGISI
jgi:hypothetical protein